MLTSAIDRILIYVFKMVEKFQLFKVIVTWEVTFFVRRLKPFYSTFIYLFNVPLFTKLIYKQSRNLSCQTWRHNYRNDVPTVYWEIQKTKDEKLAATPCTNCIFSFRILNNKNVTEMLKSFPSWQKFIMSIIIFHFIVLYGYFTYFRTRVHA